MKLYQDGDRIVITELMPMSDAPRDKTTFIGLLGGQFIIVVYSGYSDYFHDGMDDFSSDKFQGWLPIPVYEPQKI